MPKEEWGVKRVCPTTGKRFYDLNRSPIISPFTGDVVEIDLPGRKSGASAAAERDRARKAPAKTIDADDVLLDDEVEVDADEDLLEDDDDDTVSFDELSDVAGNEDES
ncbi:MAG: TIGR02300 family protein [Pararhodobacter sp.]|nr:TIGR02300 family protein [Pararhodobacter sp.]